MIEEYYFGLIIINGEKYNHDVEVRWDNKILPWRRKESHVIGTEDVKSAIEQNPELIIIGAGESGIAEVLENAQKEVLSRGIKLFIKKTGEAVKIFNDLKNQNTKLIGLFHLTC